MQTASLKKLKWGLLATGRISRTFAQGVKHSHLGELAAVGSRKLEQARSLASEFDIPMAHGSYEELLADPDVQAVYISTPHPFHAEWIIKAAEAGKHVLCEKPLTLNHAEAVTAAEAARANDVLLMEAFMIRCHPFIETLRYHIENKTIGEVRLIRATFSFATPFAPDSRLFNKALGGGSILDIGCYTTTMARLIAGFATGQPYANPLKVSGAATFLETGVDGWAVATMEFPAGILAQLSAGLLLNQENGIVIYGSGGSLHLPDCWVPTKEGGKFSLWVKPHKKGEYEVPIETDQWLFSLEADAFARALADGKRSVPEVPIADTLDNMHTLDLWRAAIGLVYESEKPSHNSLHPQI